MSHFNVSSIMLAKSQDSVLKPQFLKRKESRSGSNRGPSAYQPSALPLGHTGSHPVCLTVPIKSAAVYYLTRQIVLFCFSAVAAQPHRQTIVATDDSELFFYLPVYLHSCQAPIHNHTLWYDSGTKHIVAMGTDRF